MEFNEKITWILNSKYADTYQNRDKHDEQSGNIVINTFKTRTLRLCRSRSSEV